MKITFKLLSGFAIVSILAVSVGIAGIYSTREISSYGRFGDELAEIESLTQISNNAKNAEIHLLLYLTSEDSSDREKFFARYNLVQENIQTLENSVNDPKEKENTKKLKTISEDILSIGSKLIETRESDPRGFEIKNYLTQLRDIH